MGKSANPPDGPAAGPLPVPDPRVQLARDTLRYWDGGQWADAGTLTVGMAGHLAAAVRSLLAVIDEMQAAASGK